MDDPLAVSFVERIGNLDRACQGFAKRKRAFRQPYGKGLAVDELHHEKVNPVIVPDVMDGADIWMVERRHGARFPLEPRTTLRIIHPLGGQHFYRDFPAEARIESLIDLSHPACPDRLRNAIRAKLAADKRRSVEHWCFEKRRGRMGVGKKGLDFRSEGQVAAACVSEERCPFAGRPGKRGVTERFDPRPAVSHQRLVPFPALAGATASPSANRA